MKQILCDLWGRNVRNCMVEVEGVFGKNGCGKIGEWKAYLKDNNKP